MHILGVQRVFKKRCSAYKSRKNASQLISNQENTPTLTLIFPTHTPTLTAAPTTRAPTPTLTPTSSSERELMPHLFFTIPNFSDLCLSLVRSNLGGGEASSRT